MKSCTSSAEMGFDILFSLSMTAVCALLQDGNALSGLLHLDLELGDEHVHQVVGGRREAMLPEESDEFRRAEGVVPGADEDLGDRTLHVRRSRTRVEARELVQHLAIGD